jgi:uncharacterized protein (UPF0276 family)
MRDVLGSIPLVLDEKKCKNLKATIQHIQQLLRRELGLEANDGYYQHQREKPMSGDDITVTVEDEAEEEDVEMEEARDSHISSLREQSFYKED